MQAGDKSFESLLALAKAFQIQEQVGTDLVLSLLYRCSWSIYKYVFLTEIFYDNKMD
jgi:hypothetical protein